ncbi:PDZ domain-containing protein [Planctomicrobium sp. SH668]|uniref:PDZ domain-containing protein n=1 Tax=Planctomicrobium sp. SH668 TaxID=3448126 RepID=UPI003F5C32F1
MSGSWRSASHSLSRLVRTGLAILVLLSAMKSIAHAADLRLLEQQAIQKAVASVDASIVRIETVGGVDLVGDLLTGTGATTGIVVREDGYILTSRFNFLSNPSSVLVTLPDERKFAAEIVANDFSRMLTLLKINVTDLKPMTAVPKEDFQVGKTVIALGRTFDPKFPNISVGIISALDRVWGRALQTDAKTSPVNYGGPLIDFTGRCLGIIVPLSPQEQGETAGVEWYDSGIGFVVPLADIEKVLPRLIEKETLRPGLMGIGFNDRGPISSDARVQNVRPESPADEAGILQDDVVTEINGHPVVKLNDLKHLVGGLYAKDVVHMTIRRGDEILNKQLTLTERLKAYQFPYLGIRPDRNQSDSSQNGVGVRAVLEKTPAEVAGLKAGDVIQKVGDVIVNTPKELAQQVQRIDPGKEVTFSVRRDEEILVLTAKLEAYPSQLLKDVKYEISGPPDTPPTVKTGRFNDQLPNEGLSFWAYVPERYRADQAWGLVVWLHPPGDQFEPEMMQAWSDVCRDRGFILVGPRAGDVSGWSADQESQVRDVISVMQERYSIDPVRIVAIGRDASGPFATKLAFKYRDLFRGLVLISAAVRVPPPDCDPEYPLQLACVTSKKVESVYQLVEKTVAGMQKRSFPTVLIESEDNEKHVFSSETVSALAGWIDALDRI